jgi:hypothetical protein
MRNCNAKLLVWLTTAPLSAWPTHDARALLKRATREKD